jgi:hypothetical protein
MVLLNLRMHRAGVDGFLHRLPQGIAFQGHAAFGAIARFVRLDLGAHGAKVFGGGGRRHRGMFVIVPGIVVMLVTVCVGAVVVVVALAAATIAGVAGGFRRRSIARTTGGLGKRVLRKELFPAVLATKVKRLPIAFSAERRRFVHRHSADGVNLHFVAANVAFPNSVVG